MVVGVEMVRSDQIWIYFKCRTGLANRLDMGSERI